MLNDDEGDSRTKCRESRRRRVEMRRMAAVYANTAGSCCPVAASNHGEDSMEAIESDFGGKEAGVEEAVDMSWTHPSSGEDTEEFFPSSSAAPVLMPVMDAAPVVGVMSVSGRSREMEDAICIRPDLCRPEINRSRPVHFFGVYDGHGGPHVARLCKERMHVFMEEELMRVGITFGGAIHVGSGGSSSRMVQIGMQGLEGAEERRWRAAIRRCFQRVDEIALNTCACGSFEYQCGCHPMEVALSGSTAVVALVTATHMIVANCGDSRAVLCRAGRAVPLSYDHKPDRTDELRRIEACGGRVIFLNGARVSGILAMSRALGDKYLKPIVTSEPEISFTRRSPEDEGLILASDGLWDVLTSDLACEVASECLREGGPAASTDLNAAPGVEDEEGQSLYPSRSASAAALLTRLALGRKSSDNISVVVADLKRGRVEDRNKGEASV